MRILLVDDHAMVRKSLACVLGWEADIEVVGEAGDGKLAVEMTQELRPDIVLMDINMPMMNGIEATRRIHVEQPQVLVIGLSMFADEEHAKQILDAGAVAYVSKSESAERLVAEVRACYRRASGSNDTHQEIPLK